MDNGLNTVLILFDLTKAFDSIDHFTLLSSVKDYLSNSALQFILAYLTNRTQAVLNNDCNPSTFNKFSSGVPQGSSPAGLLFNVHINSISTSLK